MTDPKTDRELIAEANEYLAKYQWTSEHGAEALLERVTEYAEALTARLERVDAWRNCYAVGDCPSQAEWDHLTTILTEKEA